ncbi:unnamed protein product [Cuscuta campestris]|uniref:Uncharacterized protein n=1 Tax=Cuscuta campestris TaxID=132261 RepID=A0A484LVB4_9ASTE|nr:unnamed protein product [Cuscuta campestris]
MWSRFIRGGTNKTSKTHNVDEEYNDLSTKAQRHSDFLTPCQETISTVLDSLTTPKKKDNLKPILSAYFDVSAEAAILCTRLLNRIHRVQSDHKRIQALLDDDGLLSSGSVGPELHSLSTLLAEDPFSDTHNLIMGEHFSSSVLLLEQGLLRSRNKRKVELAAKGTYIVRRDLETMSRSVRRIQDEIEHNREMVRLCLDRREDSLSLGVVLKEMKNKSCGFGLQVEELQQHVCLFLVTINRVRTLVINEIVESRL